MIFLLGYFKTWFSMGLYCGLKLMHIKSGPMQTSLSFNITLRKVGDVDTVNGSVK